ncbi:fumarylacetoacetate hydrolase family protein [bacterium LRH843]|nr:fumarylacetoacetate hydrolase family protein [bacterium LRH843]
MKFSRFFKNEEIFNGVYDEGVLKVIQGDPLGEWDYTGQTFTIEEVKVLAPIEPNQIIGIGANFVAHVEEIPKELPDIPIFFFKPTSSVIGPEDDIVIPEALEEVKFESELAVIIGKDAKNVSEDDVLDYVFGYTVGNDITAPQYFHEAGNWTLGKAFDTFTPLGPFVETELDPFNISIEARVNGIEKQNSATELMIVPIRKMISYLSNVYTLKKGDVILTGSPLGAEFVKAGTEIECEIKEIGILRNTFVSARNKIEAN